mmetsp:Transcript_8933/g.21683  ORF Transcript_8933/g.21683 Transcript_8933/m.21683 type:complete len:200 (+) Transcript_8933:318-917(+)
MLLSCESNARANAPTKPLPIPSQLPPTMMPTNLPSSLSSSTPARYPFNKVHVRSRTIPYSTLRFITPPPRTIRWHDVRRRRETQRLAIALAACAHMGWESGSADRTSRVWGMSALSLAPSPSCTPSVCSRRSVSATLLATPSTVPTPPYGLLSLPQEYPPKVSWGNGWIATCPPSGWRRPWIGREFRTRPTPTPVPTVM